MNIETIKRHFRVIAMMLLALSLTGCAYWWRAYLTYLQMDEFDRYFQVEVKDDFTLKFKEGIMYSNDFVSLAKLYPSENNPTKDGRRWRYWFRKVDGNNKVIVPEVKFYSELSFNKEDRIATWSFSHLFLQIAPPEFLEVSLRSIGGAEINKEKMQLKAKTELIEKISSELPKKAAVLAHLGQPLEVKQEKAHEVYIYHFLLDSPTIEKGYEDRALSEVKLTFDKTTQELVKMAGRFAGLKISINYRKFLEETPGDDFRQVSGSKGQG